jgi:hypothetical protein
MSKEKPKSLELLLKIMPDEFLKQKDKIVVDYYNHVKDYLISADYSKHLSNTNTIDIYRLAEANAFHQLCVYMSINKKESYN